MRRPDLIDLAIVGAAFTLGYLTSPHDGSFWITLAFATSSLSVLGLLGRLGVQTASTATHQRHLVRELGGLDPVDAARQAVLMERARLSSDVQACLCDALGNVAREADARTPGEDLRPRARRIQAHAREAASELRRQLGLLRTAEGERGTDGTAAETARSYAPNRRDLAIGAVSGLLAGLEALIFRMTQSPADWSIWSVVLTALAGATLLGRRTHASVAALVCTGAIGLGWVLPHEQVTSGAWMMWTMGGLAWALGAARPRPGTLGAGLALAVIAGGSRINEDPDNAGILIVTLALAWVLGSVVGWNRRRQRAAAQHAAALQVALDAARVQAVDAERLAMARELHDVVSHAVGVIAAQAAAAEVSWPGHPERAMRAMDTIVESAHNALAELNGSVPAELPASAPHDLDALAARMRAAGARIKLRRAEVPPALESVVYRIVQEGLTNAMRHALGASIEVQVEAGAGSVRVRVRDDGPGPRGAGSGFGLTGLEERVTLRGGRLRIGSGPEGGFVIDAELPVREQASA